MHASTERLYEAAKTLNPPISGQSAVARWLNESPQVVMNWEKRGVSKQGALKAQSLAGFNAKWILSGEGEPRIGEPVERVNIFEALTEDERRLLANFRDLVDEEERHHVLEEVANKAAKMRALRERFLAELGVKTRPTAKHMADERKTELARAALRLTDPDMIRQHPLFGPKVHDEKK